MKPEALNELALFAGAGGGILGGKLLGWRTVCAVEIEAAAREVLIARQDDGSLEPFPVWDDVQTFDGKPWAGIVDVVSGGFPCQDISAAGKGAGIEGERSGLWGSMARIIREVGPRFVFVENSPVLTSRGLGVVLRDLAKMGYDARWGVLGAVHAGAPHKRERIWIVAHNPKLGRGTRREGRFDPSSEGERKQSLPAMANASGGRCSEPRSGENQQQRRAEAVGTSEAVADSTRIQSRRTDQWTERERVGESGESSREVPDSHQLNDDDGGHGTSEDPREQSESPDLRGSQSNVGHADSLNGRSRAGRQDGEEAGHASWWQSEPAVGRVAHGVAARVDRLRALGNGQVPAVVRLAWNLLR